MQIGINENGTKLLTSQVYPRLTKALDTVKDLYDSNMELLWPFDKSPYRVQTRLDYDHNTEIFRRRSPSGRRVNGVCYHGHLAFMTELYYKNSETIIRSAMASWNNVDDFDRECFYVGDRNVGSQYNPMAHEDACDCDNDLVIAVYDRFYDTIRR